MNERPMDAGVAAAPAVAGTAAVAPSPKPRPFRDAIQWLFQLDVLLQARAELAAETAEQRAVREKSRALYDAAEQLTVNGQGAPEAEAALHVEALKAAGDPVVEPSMLYAAHEASLSKLETAVRARDLAIRQRLYRLSAVALIALVLGGGLEAGIVRLLERPNLLNGKEWKTSSVGMVCKPQEHSCAGLTTDIFFHTGFDPSPWIQYDLGGPLKFSRLRVKNRQDSLPERAVPLLAEVSDDAEHWNGVARREEKFSEWMTTFTPVTARYFRLRVDRSTWLHLEEVELLP